VLRRHMHSRATLQRLLKLTSRTSSLFDRSSPRRTGRLVDTLCACVRDVDRTHTHTHTAQITLMTDKPRPEDQGQAHKALCVCLRSIGRIPSNASVPVSCARRKRVRL
jgi:hypothetical protein